MSKKAKPKVTPFTVEWWPISRPQRYAGNPRQNASAVAKVAASIQAFGWRQPIVVDTKGVIVAGDTRFLAALELGHAKVPVHVAKGLTPEQIKAYRIADNRVAQEAEWDPARLGLELQELQGMDFDLGLTGFDPGELEELLAPTSQILDDSNLDEVPPPPAKPLTKLGDVIKLGRHTLICADSANPKTWEMLELPARVVCITDPPYGIGLDYGPDITDDESNLRKLAEKWVPLARQHCSLVAFSPGVTRAFLYPEPSWVLCWFYGGGQLRSPWGFNCWQPFLVYGKDPSLATGNGCKPDAVDLNVPANAAELDHPCPKPLAIWLWLFERLSYDVKDIVIDPFAGAGTSVIAGEKFGREVRMVELSPAYCDVTIQRWEQATGQKAIRPR